MRNTIPIVFVAATVLAGCGSTSRVHTQTATPTTAATVQKGSREGLEFLADIPSLKDVSLKMTEAEFADILHQQKLDYKRDVSAGQTTYSVEPAAHVIVLFMFRESHCSGIQRLQD
jgi:hypothetical protein